MRKVSGLLLAILALSLAPLGARAAHSCDVFMFSGIAGAGAVNLGAAGCSGNHSTAGATDVITPGSDFVRGGVLISRSTFAPTGASVTFLNGTSVIATVPVTFAVDPANAGRYVTGDVPITGARANATHVKISATLSIGARSTTYTRVA